MARKYPHIALLFVVAACGNERAATDSASAQPREIELKDAAGALVLTLSVTPERCTASGSTDLAVVRNGADAVATTGANPILTLGPGRTGTEVRDADGTSRLRVIEQAGRIDLVSQDGVPIARIFTTEAQASVVDAARVQLFTVSVAADGDHLATTHADGSPPETITGTTDLTLAAVLALPGVPPDVRALIACARLLPAAVSNAGSVAP